MKDSTEGVTGMPSVHLDSVLSLAETLYSRADAAATGKWDGVVDAAYSKNDPRSYIFPSKAAQPKELGGGKQLVGGAVMKPRPRRDEKKYNELTRKMQALENSGKPYESVSAEYEKLSRERDRL